MWENNFLSGVYYYAIIGSETRPRQMKEEQHTLGKTSEQQSHEIEKFDYLELKTNNTPEPVFKQRQ